MKKMHLPRLLGVYSSLLLSTFLLSYSASAQVVTYCVPEGTNPNRYINDFSTNGGDQSITNNGSGFSADGYGDYTGLTAEQGYGGSVNFNASFEGGTAGFRIWVDWNHDGFFDTDEVAYQSNSYSTSHSGSVSVPASAMLGSTRMRIVSHWYSISGVVDPCETDFPYGEFEDYTFVVASEASWDCPDLETNFGDACDDGDPNTVDDTVTEDCGCEGIPVATNDEACTATAIACDDVIVQSLMEATSSMEDGCDGTGSVDVWFSFTCNGSQTYTIGETSSFDAVVQLFMGDDCNNLTEAGSCSDPNEEYEITDAGNYYFRVRPYYAADDEGTITVSLICGGYDCPELGADIGDACDDGDPGTENDTVTEDCDCVGQLINDDCDGAIPLECGQPIPGTTIGATSYGLVLDNQCDGWAMGSPLDVWYFFEADGTSNYTVTVSSTDPDWDGVLFFYSGDCTGLVYEACADNAYPYRDPESITLEGLEIGTYYVRTYSWGTTGKSFTIELTCLSFCPELEANIGDACDDGDSGTYNDTVDENCDCVGILFDCYELEANIGDACDDGDLGTYNDVLDEGCNCVGISYDCQILQANIGDTCDDGDAATFGDYVNEDCECIGQPNDECVGAVMLECGHSSLGTSFGATPSVVELDNFCDGNSLNGDDVWYSFEANGTANYTITVSSTDLGWDGVLFVYSGDCADLVYEACSDNAPYPYYGPESITLEGLETGTYYVRTYNWGTTGKSFTIELTCECPALEANIGDACDDGDPETENDTVTEDCECVGTVIYDCPELEANIGDACDDGDPNTENDAVTEDCECVGMVIYDCPALEANIGDACDDGDPSTENDTVTEDCDCVGTYVCTDPQPAVTGMWVEYIEGDGMLGHWNPVANSIACQHRLYTADNVLVNKTTQWEFEADNYLGSNWLFDYGTDYIWAIRCGCNDDPVIAGPWSTLAFNTPSGPSMISSPNPTSGISNVTFEVASEEHTTLEVYDMSGRSLEVLYNGMASPKNEYRFQFNGTGLPAGVYIYRLTTDSDVVIEKFMIAK